MDVPLGPSEMGLTCTPESRQLIRLDEEVMNQGYDSDGNIRPFFDQVEGKDNTVMDDKDK